MPVQDKKVQVSYNVSVAMKRVANNNNDLFAEAQKTGNGVWQLPIEERQKLVAPVVAYAKKDGSYGIVDVPPDSRMALLQAGKNMGSKDPCWISVYDAKQAGMKAAKGVKPVKIVMFKKDGYPYVKEFLNRSQLSGNVPTIDIPKRTGAQIYMNDMLDILALQDKNKQLSSEKMLAAVIHARTGADSAYRYNKQRYDLATLDLDAYLAARLENNKRFEEITAVDLSKPINRNNDKEAFQHLCASEIRNRDIPEGAERSPFVRASVRAMTEFKWNLEKVKAALKELLPTAAYDHLVTKGRPSAESVADKANNFVQQKASEHSR